MMTTQSKEDFQLSPDCLGYLYEQIDDVITKQHSEGLDKFLAIWCHLLDTRQRDNCETQAVTERDNGEDKRQSTNK